jgi:hypothetical protein
MSYDVSQYFFVLCVAIDIWQSIATVAKAVRYVPLRLTITSKARLLQLAPVLAPFIRFIPT